MSSLAKVPELCSTWSNAASPPSGEGLALLDGQRTRLLEQAREEDFFDARSEAASECGTPRGGHSLYTPAQTVGYVGRVLEAQEKLSALLDIECRCREGKGGNDRMNELTVESILKEEFARLWFCYSKHCPFVIGCLVCKLSDVLVEDALQAIQNPQQRLCWDAESFKSFELFRAHDPEDPTREDVIFTVMPAPRPVRDREILQHRWQLPLGSSGGQALLMQSFEDDTVKPPNPDRVRAFTHLSGYLLRPTTASPAVGGPDTSGLEVVVVSQCDLGGALPGWFQNLARRLAKRRCVAWGHKLQEHCQGVAKERNFGP